MKSIELTNDAINGNDAIGSRFLKWFPLLFLLITPFALYLDSVTFTKAYFDLRWLVNSCVIIFFCAFYYFSDLQLRKLMLIMVPLSYLGEWIFSKWFGWYTYRLEEIPIYVPFGHAIVYGAGYVVAGYKTVITYEVTLRKLFSIGFILLFAGVTIFVEDYFSCILGVLFFWLIYRKKWQNLYFLIALCVIYIELWGTWYGCWTWEAKIGGILPTANPPMGAVFLYGGGDVLLARIVRRWDRYRANS